MKNSFLLYLLPSAAVALTANRTAVPGMKVVSMDDNATESTLAARANGRPDYHFKYGPYTDCETWYIETHGDVEQPCQAFQGDARSVLWTNPSNPSDVNGAPYWNFVLYFHGDDCPVIGHPIQCDTVGTWCVTFNDGMPLSYNVVGATTGIRNCDV